jgi:heme-degrading monooxygenase HmoA
MKGGGMHARTGRLQVSPELVDEMVRILTAEQLPRYRGHKGFKGFTVLANRETGDVIGTSFWETEADMDAAEELGDQARAMAAEAGDATVDPVTERWEVLLDDTA